MFCLVFSYKARYGEDCCEGEQAEGDGCESDSPWRVVEEEADEGDEGEAHADAKGGSLDVVHARGATLDLGQSTATVLTLAVSSSIYGMTSFLVNIINQGIS